MIRLFAGLWCLVVTAAIIAPVHYFYVTRLPPDRDIPGNAATIKPPRSVDVAMLLKTPLFEPSRKTAARPVPRPRAQAPRRAPPRLSVKAHLVRGETRTLYVVDPEGVLQKLSVGDMYQGWRVAQISTGSITFLNGSRRHILELDHDKKR